MKRIAIFIFAVLLFASDAFSQNTIKFLGIPIDGTKKSMIDALKARGYTYNSVQDVLSGEFNGQDVNISVQTINNRVWRIAVVDKSFTDETNIKIRFNLRTAANISGWLGMNLVIRRIFLLKLRYIRNDMRPFSLFGMKISMGLYGI